MASIAKYKVGVIIGSQRVVRVCPQIAAFVLDTIRAHREKSGTSASPAAAAADFELVDVATLGLPLYDEPGVPSQVTDRPGGYAHEHTRAWSARVAALDAFIFVSPQYNWSVPAGLKNAIDYLFHEWKGKPAAVVTYGAHGGDKCADDLMKILGGGIGMRMVTPTVNLSFPDRESLVKGAMGQQLGLDVADDGGIFAGYRPAIEAAWNELFTMMEVGV